MRVCLRPPSELLLPLTGFGPAGGALDGKGREVRDGDNREEAARGPRLRAFPLDDPGRGKTDRQGPRDRGGPTAGRREVRQRLENLQHGTRVTRRRRRG